MRVPRVPHEANPHTAHPSLLLPSPLRHGHTLHLSIPSRTLRHGTHSLSPPFVVTIQSSRVVVSSLPRLPNTPPEVFDPIGEGEVVPMASGQCGKPEGGGCNLLAFFYNDSRVAMATVKRRQQHASGVVMGNMVLRSGHRNITFF